MPLQFTTIEEPSFDRGIDARSAENQIKAGFARDLVNVDIVESRIRKRRGYVSYAGNIPVRVQRISQVNGSPDTISFLLDSSIDLARVSSCPLLVYGKSGSIASGGPFTTSGNTSRYYPSWTSNLRKSFLASTSTGAITAASTEHNIATSQMFVGLAASDSGETLSGQTIFSTDVTIGDTSKLITVNYGNNSTTTQSVFLYYRDQQPVIGKSYTHPTFSVAPSSSPVSISAATHGLDNYNIIYQLYEEDGSNWIQCKPNSFTVNASTGTVEIGISPYVTKNYRLILASVPLSQTSSTSISSGIPIPGTGSSNSHTLFNIESPFLFFTVYKKVGNTLEEVFVDQSIYDDVTKEWTLGWTADPALYDTTFEIYYEYGSIRANEIIVTDAAVTSSAVDTVPQLVIWGLDHETIYGTEKNTNRRGWVTHLDSYRSPTTTHVVAGLGGNLFAALGQSASPNPSLLPTYFPNLNARVSNTAQVIGPAFYEASSIPVAASKQRSRGYFTFTGGLFNWGTVSQVVYQNDGTTKYRLLTPGREVKPNSSYTPVEPGDLLTIEKMSHSRHNGTFTIVDLDDSNADYLEFFVVNPKLASSDYDDLGAGGRGGVFSDYVTLNGTSPFLVDDTLKSSAWGEETILSVYGPKTQVTNASTGTTLTVSSTKEFPSSGTLYVNGVAKTYNAKTNTTFILDVAYTSVVGHTVALFAPTKLPVTKCYNYIPMNAGMAITGQRVSATIPLRTITNVATVDNIVAGDILSFSEITRPLTVVSVDASAKTITLDESLSWYDDLSIPPEFSVLRRWHPVEVPTRTATDTLIPLTTIQHFASSSYDNQPFLRSAMVQNNMYLTNGEDEVYKYDGANLYRAGIIPWQPGLFAAVENVQVGGIALPPKEATNVTLSGTSLQMTVAEAAKFKENDIVQVKFSNLSEPLTLTIDTIKDASSTHKSLSFKETLVGVTSTSTVTWFRGVYYASYFFRLNVKDKNGVTVASAVTGADSFVVTLVPTTSGQNVLLRLVGLPPWDQYDYRSGNIELEIYRNAWTTASVGGISTMYRLATLPLTFETNSGYIDFTDTYGNNALSDEDTDVVSRVLSPTTIPSEWNEPMRSKYLTTVGNRLVLANVRSWPSLDVYFLANKDTTYSSFVGQSFLFRRDSADTGSTTNMVDRVKYELVDGTNSANYRTIYPETGALDEFNFTSTAPLPNSVAAGSWVYLYHSTVTSGSQSSGVFFSGNTLYALQSFLTPPAANTLVHFSSTGQLPPEITDTRGYFVAASNAGGTALTSGTQNSPGSTVTVSAATANFPTSGAIYLQDQAGNSTWHTYTGTTVAAGVTASFTGVSPAVTYNNNVSVVVGASISVKPTYTGSAITFSTAGTGTHSLLWDGSELNYAGWWQVHVVNSNTITVKDTDSHITDIPKQFPDRALFASDTKDVPVLLGTDGNMGMSTGNGPVPYLNVIRRLGMAINATMRVTDTTLSSNPDQRSFVPWLMAQSEGFTGGVLRVRRPRADAVTPSLTVAGGTLTAYKTYINDEPAPTAAAVLARTTKYPSRVLLSYDNYPEIFDNPFTLDLSTTDSAVDVNAADGQELTGIFPFFGSSAFGAAQQGGVLVAFKSNSIYLIDITTRQVQKLETQGLGCTAPYSIAATKDGIAFANESGIYVLRRDLRIEYMGRFVERAWQEKVDLNALSLAQGHHYGIGKQYKLSVPMVESSLNAYAENEEVYVYAYTAEADGALGGWTRYTNHATTGWCNLFQDAFFADVNGRVQQIRNLGDASDYRDGSAAIESIVETRPTSFENSSIRKVVSGVTVHYRTDVNSDSTALGMSVDLATEYQVSSSFKVVTQGVNNGLSNTIGQSVTSIYHSFPRRRCIYAAVQIVNNGKDENVEIAGMSYQVAGLSAAGIKQAAETEG